MNRDTFAGYHPVVNFLYFLAVLGLGMFIMHPVCLGISLVCAVAYSGYLKGAKGDAISAAVHAAAFAVDGAAQPWFLTMRARRSCSISAMATP